MSEYTIRERKCSYGDNPHYTHRWTEGGYIYRCPGVVDPNVDTTGAAAEKEAQRLVIADSAILEAWDDIQELIRNTASLSHNGEIVVRKGDLSNFAIKVIRAVAKHGKN